MNKRPREISEDAIWSIEEGRFIEESEQDQLDLAKPTDGYTYLTERDDLWSYLLTRHPAEGAHLHRELRENNPNALWRLLTLETDHRHDQP